MEYYDEANKEDFYSGLPERQSTLGRYLAAGVLVLFGSCITYNVGETRGFNRGKEAQVEALENVISSAERRKDSLQFAINNTPIAVFQEDQPSFDEKQRMLIGYAEIELENAKKDAEAAERVLPVLKTRR